MKQILVVDDSRLITLTLKNLIEEKLGLRCITAATKMETQEKLIKYKGNFEVALLDLGLPDAPNGEVIDTVKKFKIPIIILTATADAEKKFREKEIVDYVIKDGAYSIYYALNILQQLIKNKSIKVLAVDDSKVFLAKLTDLLKRYKLNVLTASDGKEALEVIKANPDIKVVFTDYDMPNMDGLALTRELRKKYKKSELAIIVTSATARSNYIPSKFLKYGANDFLTKDFSIEEFYTRLNSNLEILSLFEEKEEEEKKNREKDKMLFEQSKMATIGEVLGNISHHWRQPLNIISTIAGSLQTKKEFGIEEREDEIKSYEKIISVTKELSDTIENFKNFFSSSENKQDFNIVEVIKEYIDIIEPTFLDENIDIQFGFSNEFIVNGDKSSFQQVLINLFNNSKEALLRNKIKNGFIKIEIKKDQKNILIYFSDNANGIDEDIIDKIFEPYFTTKHQDYGTGLGLYISREIIRNQFNGKINVVNSKIMYNNIEYNGCKFIVMIPLNKGTHK